MAATHRLVLILLLTPLVGMGGTFELQDPAAEIYEKKQNPTEPEQAGEKPVAMEEVFCALDETEGKCWCVHKETAKVVTIEHEKCVMHAAETSSTKR